MAVGKVKWFDTKKGFGFILDQEGRDIFVHFSVIEGDGYRRLWDGDEVEFELIQGPKGFLAGKAKRLGPPMENRAGMDGELLDGAAKSDGRMVTDGQA